MATPSKKPSKKVATVRNEDLTPLEIHAIQLHELYKAFRKAGFPIDIAIGLITEPTAHPSWFKLVPDIDILDEEEEED
jgi:hypothetical protein